MFPLRAFPKLFLINTVTYSSIRHASLEGGVTLHNQSTPLFYEMFKNSLGHTSADADNAAISGSLGYTWNVKIALNCASQHLR